MSDAEELEQIERDVLDLGRQLEAKRHRALEILKDRVALVRGNRFRIQGARAYAGGAGYRLFFEGPRLKQNGDPWANAQESAPLRLLDFEPLSHS